MKARILLAGALVAGCPAVDEPSEALPDGLRAVGVVQANGASSALVPWPAGAPLPVVTAGAGPDLVYAYDEAALSPFGEAWRQGRLQTPAPCVTALPTPTWFGRLEGGVLTPLDPADAPPVTVDGLTSVCPPAEAAELVLDVRGTYERCPQRGARVGCSVQVRTECGLGDFAGWIGPDGGACLIREGGTWACPPAPLESGAPTVCDLPRREVEPVPVPDEIEPPFTVETFSLVTREPYLPSLLGGSNQLFPYHLRQGHAYAMVALEDALLVSVGLGSGGDCRAPVNAATELLFLDPDALRILRRVPGPTCPLHAVALPDGFVLTELDERWRFVRYDTEGTRLDEVSTGLTMPQYSLQQTVAMPDRDLAVSFFRPSLEMLPDPQSLAVFLRLSDLSIVATATLAGLPTVAGAVRVDERTIALTEETDRLAWLDVETRQLTRIEAFPEQDTLGIRMLQPHVLGDRLVTTVSSFPGGTLWSVLGPGLETVVRNPLDAGYSPVTVVPWSDGRWLTLGVSLSVGPRVAQVAFYDPQRDAFDPGLWTVGGGAAASAIWDEAGRLLVLLPWSGELVRLTPR